MTISPWLGYAAGVAGIGLFSRVWVKFRRDRRMRREYQTPLFDPYLLDNALAAQESEDPAVLGDLRETLSHLNRRCYAAEFWDLSRQLADYYNKLPRQSRPTMRAALLRLLAMNDRWLQTVAARTCASLSLREATLPLRAILEIGDSMLRPAEKPIETEPANPDARFRAEIEASLNALERASAPPTASL